jgi:hypothetical protein
MQDVNIPLHLVLLRRIFLQDHEEVDGGLIYQKHRPLRRIECTHSTQTEELSVCSLHTCFNTAALFHVLMLLIPKPPSFNG